MFDKSWFIKHQKLLLKFADSFIGRYILHISKKEYSGKVVGILPNIIFFQGSKGYRAEIKSSNEYALVISRTFRPLWYLFHFWDWIFYPRFNLGFDTLVIQPGEATSNDTWIDKANPDVNNDGDGFLRIQAFTSAAFTKRTIIKFDVSSLPSQALVTKATLTLYLSSLAGAGTFTVESHSISRSWTEAGATWNKYDGVSTWTTAGGDFSGTVLSSVSVSVAGVAYDWDIPVATINTWVGGTNNGVLFKGSDEDAGINDRFFSNSADATASLRPKLSIDFQISSGFFSLL